ncbi:MarR family transcriptional regulator [Pedobacter psychrodurus]|uniref:MarR family transcriptional regulator n=1 Tax=Pedobacter psychrodurus TaxID=2530456 RepID=A0A4R0Q070_9SPHI|nr:MarR family winged helix-turn-helix transcriptional regulator [Pedobacter psychrodurus]TCD26526.1 MarR family transcriptional regulator [Pedobacter psychrodurus]
MMYNLLSELIALVKTYESSTDLPKADLASFISWLNDRNGNREASAHEPVWEGKAKGRSADSVINTSLVHLYRYAKFHAKAAITGSSFSTPDDFIYLISLASGGSMSKTALIKQNIHEKATGTLIVNRLQKKGLVEQHTTDNDKRSRIIHITPKGSQQLKEHIENIKIASANVTAPLSDPEKMALIRLLLKLEDFHHEKSSGKL